MQAKTPPRSGGVFVCHNNPEKLMCDKYYWWSRGESNPCPKVTWKELLRAQFVICIPSFRREQTPYGNQ